MGSYRKLLNNSIIFAVGDLGSKLISFILVPLYTYYLTTAEYGTIDLITTTVSLLLPIISLSIFDAVLRFVMSKDNNPDDVLSNALIVPIIGFISALILYPLLRYFNVLTNQLIYLYVLLFVEVFERIFAHFTRAIGKMKTYAANGILRTFTTGTLNILFLVVFRMGINGYLLSLIFAYFISILFLFFANQLYKYLKINSIDRQLIKLMLLYSIPLITNSVMWWLINGASRYFIRYFISLSANGLFGVASRIPVIVNIINTIFTQAWQLSAIEEFENQAAEDFYNKIYHIYSSTLLIASSLLIVIVKPMFNILFAAEYYEAWSIVPLLLLSTVFSALSSFVGSTYIAAKKTKGAFKTSILGGAMSLGLNLIMIPLFGIIGAAIASLISFFVMFIARYIDTKKMVNLNINWKLISTNVGLILMQFFALNQGFIPIIELALTSMIFLLLLFINREVLKEFLLIIIVFLRKKKNVS